MRHVWFGAGTLCLLLSAVSFFLPRRPQPRADPQSTSTVISPPPQELIKEPVKLEDVPPPPPLPHQTPEPNPEPPVAKQQLPVQTPSAGLYLQVLSLPNAEAQTLAENLSANGFSPLLAPGPSERLVRVLIPARDIEDAAIKKTQLASHGYADAFPKRYEDVTPVVPRAPAMTAPDNIIVRISKKCDLAPSAEERERMGCWAKSSEEPDSVVFYETDSKMRQIVEACALKTISDEERRQMKCEQALIHANLYQFLRVQCSPGVDSARWDCDYVARNRAENMRELLRKRREQLELIRICQITFRLEKRKELGCPPPDWPSTTKQQESNH